MTAKESIPDAHSDLPRGRTPSDIGVAPHSYFESPENLAATGALQFEPTKNAQGKLFLGVVNGRVVTGDRLADGRVTRYVTGGTPIGVPTDRHHLIVAGSRAGKGRAGLLPILLSLPPSTSVVIVDPKGDLARISAVWRKKLGQKVAVLDPFNVSGESTKPFRAAFNPLSILKHSDASNFVPNCKLIADSLVVSGDFKDRHWDECARAILACIVAHVATYHRYASKRDLITCWQLAAELATPDPERMGRYLLEEELLSNDAALVRAGARQFYDRTGGEFSSVLSNLRKHLDFLSIEAMHPCLEDPSVELRDLKRDSMALYVTLPAMRMTDLSGWLRLVVQLTLAVHEEERQQVGGATVLIIDEAHILKTCSSLEVAAAQFAGVVTLVTVLQDLTQLQRNYEKSWETFVGNTGCIQIFGLFDSTTEEYFAKRLGDAPTLTRSTNAPGFEQAVQHGLSGESWSLGTHPLLTPEELRRFFARDDHKLRQLILRPGYRPAILQRAFYDKHEIFRGRYADV